MCVSHLLVCVWGGGWGGGSVWVWVGGWVGGWLLFCLRLLTVWQPSAQSLQVVLGLGLSEISCQDQQCCGCSLLAGHLLQHLSWAADAMRVSYRQLALGEPCKRLRLAAHSQPCKARLVWGCT
jgi:hypothetical protein